MEKWLRPIWDLVDGELRGVSKKLKRVVRNLRLARAWWMFSIVLVYASAAMAVAFPEYIALCFAVAAVALSANLWVMMSFFDWPLRQRSIIRLIDKGYPANARELAIRVAVRKLRDQSIETEEMLVETAINEGKKVYRKYKDRAADLADEMEQG